jgi:hypothetical protein
MRVEVMEWDEIADSARGLLARPILPGNIIALREHIDTITYEIYKVGSSDPPVTGILDVADVMLVAPSGKKTWRKDEIGFTFNWQADGSLWPTAGESYQIIVIFTTKSTYGSKTFKRIWRVNTKDPVTIE